MLGIPTLRRQRQEDPSSGQAGPPSETISEKQATTRTREESNLGDLVTATQSGLRFSEFHSTQTHLLFLFGAGCRPYFSDTPVSALPLTNVPVKS